MAFKTGDTVFIVESNRFIREVEVRSCGGGMYLVRFKDNGGGIRLKEHRLFATKEEAEASIKREKKEKDIMRGNPYLWDGGA